MSTFLSSHQQLQTTTGVDMPTPKTPRPPKKTYPVNVRLDEETLEMLRAIAYAEDRTISNLIARALKEWLATRKSTGG
jgi:Ribbon-helix-helix protein, copG family